MAGERVLIVEDNQMNLELARDLLEMSGYLVQHAETAELGIQVAKAELPDLILMDISLPGMDGLEATRLLKADSATQDVPVIALTAHAMKGEQERSLAAGCVGYISKPIDTREFAKEVARYIDRSSPT